MAQHVVNGVPLTPEETEILKLFKYEHLPKRLQEASKPFFDLAFIIAGLPANFEKIASLRKLLESKDCAVRCKV